ncbi:MAG: hypothetical protein H0V02_07510 [Nocardioidaceae bacterium]|nr:hypothetical protein [Nocardioidaceae bacterium]
MTNLRKPSLNSSPKPPHEMAPIRSQADLERHWRLLMGPLGFARPQLWLNVLAPGGQPTSFLAHLEDLPAEPDVQLLDRVMEINRQLLDSRAVDGSLALLLARPGPDRRTGSDVVWAAALTEAAGSCGIPLRPIYLATDTDIRIISPDDLLAASA